MKIQQFLQHHGIGRNPFAEEDAQNDVVFQDHCISSTFHPSWDKVYGDPERPATAIVFGEKGSGKTAMRLQIARHLRQHNADHPRQRAMVIHYDDWNPFLDRFRDRLPVRKRRSPDRVLTEWKLWDHMDALLSLAATGLTDAVLGQQRTHSAVEANVATADLERLSRHQRRDLLLLAACYDQSLSETFQGRWQRLRRALRFTSWRARGDLAVGIAGSLAILATAIALAVNTQWSWLGTLALWLPLPLLAAWGWWLVRAARRWWMALGVLRQVRVGTREVEPLRQVLMHFTGRELASQPLPRSARTDDRYEMLLKLQDILETLGFVGIVVLVDRVDEPHLINGSAELMKAAVWPMLDNKFLTQPGIGFKLMLPIELTRFIEREEREFYQRARLDKQNTISSFAWSGEALHDVMNARIRACAVDGAQPSLRDLFDPGLSEQRLTDTWRSLRVPRHVFKFLYRLLVTHCNAHTDDAPVWQIPRETFDATLAVYLRDQDAFDRGVGAGS